ncbi:hypothetical protein NDN01_14920 [Sphingomonas sp. QA11]|uniref:hypothetical protein n=1 Tax=Sphingomonas sp. QA11 TaxID=2950605 RepID=UPI00234B86B7|nr:hypothetical protein [Sphingomonas sp. QA11]WCM25350.1 hypothetical protein NDN01_14920 [Sphingomonas sp. QA11]
MVATTPAPLPPQQPVGYSGLYPTADTAWSIANGQVMVAQVTSSVAATPQPFVFKGVRYQPTPLDINGGAAGTPMGDFYYIGMNGTGPDAKTMMMYQPIWTRDVGPNGLIRQLGANNIGVYGSFNMPPFTLSNSDGSGTVVSSAGNAAIDWTALGPIRYVEAGGVEYPTYMPQGADAKQAPPYWYHYCHDGFLDMCWNDGVDPIYVFLSVGVSTAAFFSANTAPASGYEYTQVQQYYLDTATWLGQSYGHHPALAGFYITNETNQPGPTGTYQYREYWDFLNRVGKALKEGAPNKLTLAAMQDDISTLTTQLMQYTTPPVPGGGVPDTQLLYVDSTGQITTTATNNQPAYSTDIYDLDLWGWNLYAAPGPTTPIISYLSQRKAANLPMAPVVLSEIGIPQAMRYTQVAGTSFGTMGGNDPYVVNPNGYQAVWGTTVADPTTDTLTLQPYLPGTILGQESLAVVTTTNALRTSSNFFTDNPDYNAGGLVAYESDTGNYYLFQGVPQNPDSPGLPAPSWVLLDATIYGTLLAGLMASPTPLAAAGPAVALYAYLQAANAYQVGNNAVAAANQLLQGVQVFEFSDEWYKWMDPSVTDPTTIQTASGVHDFRDTAIAPWGPANAQFYTTWEEEWFGLCSVLPNGRSSTDPAINTYGWLAGNGADLLTPRASYMVVQQFFGQ